MPNLFRTLLEEAAESARRFIRDTSVPPTTVGLRGRTTYDALLGLRREVTVSIVTADGGREKLVKLEVVFPGTKVGESAVGPLGTVTGGQEAILRTFVEGGEKEILSVLKDLVGELIRLGVPQADLVRAFDGALSGYVMEE